MKVREILNVTDPKNPFKKKSSSVNVKDLNKNIIEYANTLEPEFRDLLLATSGNDDDHAENSRHYTNNAVDFRFSEKLYERMKNDPNRIKFGVTLLDPGHGTANHIHLSTGNASENKKDVWMDVHSDKAKKHYEGHSTEETKVDSTPNTNINTTSVNIPNGSTAGANYTSASITEDKKTKELTEVQIRKIFQEEKNKQKVATTSKYQDVFKQEKQPKEQPQQRQQAAVSSDWLDKYIGNKFSATSGKYKPLFAEGGECGTPGNPPCVDAFGRESSTPFSEPEADELDSKLSEFISSKGLKKRDFIKKDERNVATSFNNDSNSKREEVPVETAEEKLLRDETFNEIREESIINEKADKIQRAEDLIKKEEKEKLDQENLSKLLLGENKRTDLNKPKEVEEQPLNLSDYKTVHEVKELQRKLKSEGYDINPSSNFKGDGIDGIAGNVTKSLIGDYNRKLEEDKDTGVKYVDDQQGERGKLGKCFEEQCSEYSQNEAYRRINPNVSQEVFREELGTYGDAWNILDNIRSKGGKKIESIGVKAGDYVGIYTGGRSSFQNQANEKGAGYTHSGVISEVFPDGSYIISHNIHEGTDKVDDNGKVVYQGYEYRTKVDKNGKLVGDGNSGAIGNVVDIARPNYEMFEQKEDKTSTHREDTKLQFRADTFKIPDNSSTKKALISIGTVANDKKFKKTIGTTFNLDETEYQTIVQLTAGIMGQETNFNEKNIQLYGKEVAAQTAAVGRNTLLGEHLSGYESLPYVSKEASRGATRMKFNMNFPSGISELGLSEPSDLSDTGNAFKATAYKLSQDYKAFIKKGFSKKDAVYRAVQKYNGKLSTVSAGKSREDWAKEYDLDYVNSVVTYGTMFDVKDEKGNSYKTILDEIAGEKNVQKIAKDLQNYKNYKNNKNGL